MRDAECGMENERRRMSYDIAIEFGWERLERLVSKPTKPQ